MTNLNFPSILKNVGYSLYNFNLKPCLIIINEYANMFLSNLLFESFKNNAPPEWNSTKK